MSAISKFISIAGVTALKGLYTPSVYTFDNSWGYVRSFDWHKIQEARRRNRKNRRRKAS